MKKLLALILTILLTVTCLASCDIEEMFGKKSGVGKQIYENCAVFTFNGFESKICITLDRTGLDEGAIYYQVNLEEGALSVSYKHSVINVFQPLGDFTADDEMPINGSGGYVEGNKITITFESDSPVKGEIIIAFTEDAFKQHHEHTYIYICNEDTHQICYTCGCLSTDDSEEHINYDADLLCDVCGYSMHEPPTPTNHFLRNQAGCQWINEITADDIAEIKITEEAVGVAPGALKNITSSTDQSVIADMFEKYYWMDTAPIADVYGEIDGGGAVTVDFVLKNGVVKELHFNNGNYRDTNGAWFDLLYIPKFSYGTDFIGCYGFVTYTGKGTVGQLLDGSNLAVEPLWLCEIPMDEIEFGEVEIDFGENEPVPTHIVETEFGALMFIDHSIFYINGESGYYYLVGKNLDELIEGTYTDPDNDCESGYDAGFKMIQYNWDGYGVLKKEVYNCDLGYAIIDCLSELQGTGYIIPGISDDVVNEFSEELPIARGTVWIECGRVGLFRLNPEMTEICKVQTHLGEGQELQMTDTLKELLVNAWYYHPYDYWSGSYENGTVTGVHGGMTKVSATYKGTTYTCIVRVA